MAQLVGFEGSVSTAEAVVDVPYSSVAAPQAKQERRTPDNCPTCTARLERRNEFDSCTRTREVFRSKDAAFAYCIANGACTGVYRGAASLYKVCTKKSQFVLGGLPGAQAWSIVTDSSSSRP